MELTELNTKMFADGAVLEDILELAARPYVRGFTTNPTLMRKAGVTDYESFARLVLERVTDLPVSFEVFSDEIGEMRRQALEIASWAPNVYAKVPITNTRRDSTAELIKELAAEGVKVNVTGILTVPQVETAVGVLSGGAPSFVSVFAGRIADTGRDPIPIMKDALRILRASPSSELIWASPRELLNLIQAHEIGCHIITMTGDLLAKIELLGKDLDQYSLDTVKMFFEDANRSGLRVADAAART
jgi:transaldolase